MKNPITLLVVAVVVVGIAFQITSYCHINTIEAKIEGKERITESVGNGIKSYYLVYTDKGTFSLEDDMFRGNFYSSDVYGKLKQDSIYKFTTSGYRIGFINSYPNIIEVK
jgi:hypothetical protein